MKRLAKQLGKDPRRKSETMAEETPALAEENAPVANDSALPDGWTEEIDEVSGRTYLYHAASSETTWERPTSEAPIAEHADAEESAGENVEGVEETKDGDLVEETEPAGPEAASDPKASVDKSLRAASLPAGWS